MRLSSKLFGVVLLLADAIAAHPGHDIAHEAAERRQFLNSVQRSSISHCADKLKARGVQARNIARRSAQISQVRQQHGLRKRSLDSVLSASHNQTDAGYTLNTDASPLFAGNNSCVLTPEVTQGPYCTLHLQLFILLDFFLTSLTDVAGEYVRENIIESQEGVHMVLDYQVVDVNTCDPVPDVYLEMWHCNSTGVYSGIVASGNGDSSDGSNINNTWLRGIQKTDCDGVAQFQSVFPGHYTSRATHIHIMVHANATLLPNMTLGRENYASHVGQAFFDQDLIAQVEKLEPYASNTQELTKNAADGILSEETATDGVDPFMEYTLLTDDIQDGIFAWLAFGINTTGSDSIVPAAYYYKGGGVSNGNAGMGNHTGGGNDSAPGGGSPPSGLSRAPASITATGV